MPTMCARLNYSAISFALHWNTYVVALPFVPLSVDGTLISEVAIWVATLKVGLAVVEFSSRLNDVWPRKGWDTHRGTNGCPKLTNTQQSTQKNVLKRIIYISATKCRPDSRQMLRTRCWSNLQGNHLISKWIVERWEWWLVTLYVWWSHWRFHLSWIKSPFVAPE